MKIGSRVILKDNALVGNISGTVGDKWIVKVERSPGGGNFWVVLGTEDLEEVEE